MTGRNTSTDHPAARRSSRILIAAVGLLLLAGSLPLFAQTERLICNCDSDNGARITWGDGCETKSLTVNHDRAFLSQGAGSLHLKGHVAAAAKGNSYLGFDVPVQGGSATGSAVDLRGKALIFDVWTSTPKALRALYVRLYDGKGQRVGSWSTFGAPLSRQNHRTFTVVVGRNSRPLTWEAKEVKGEASAVARLEWVAGANEPNADFDLYVDNVRVSDELPVTLDNLRAVKKLVLPTVLTAGGAAKAAIVAPSGEAAAARRLQEQLKQRFGVELPIEDAAAVPAEQWGSESVLLLGNILDNPLIADLYMHYYTPVDAYFPGAGGYLMETVHDPWGTGNNAVVIGVSAEGDLTKAVDAFVRALPADMKGALPPLFHIELGPSLQASFSWIHDKLPASFPTGQVKAGEQALTAGAHTGVFSQVANLGERYMLTRDPQYALAFRDVVKLAYAHYQTKPKTYGGPWGMDSDFTVYRVIPGWDNVEECPALSEQDRLEVTRILAKWVADVAVPPASSVIGSSRVRFNHQTFPSLGLYYAGRYFKLAYHAQEAQDWLDTAHECFDFQMGCFKSNEDCNGYQWLTIGHTMRYCLASRDYRWLQNGNAAREADYAIICMDNLGYQVPYGDTGSYQCWWTEQPFLEQTSWALATGPFPDATLAAEYQWVVDRKHEVHGPPGMYECNTGGPTRRPDLLTGVITVPVDPTYYATNGSGPPALDKCVDKVVMRSDFDPNHQYLLLDGLSNGGHRHLDGNTISRITDRGRIWLADNDYYLSLPKFHNGVLIFKDGQSATIPGFCELDGRADLPHFGYTATTVRNYAGVDWHRNILWSKGRFFLVLDEMRAREASDYSFRTVWQLVGQPHREDTGVTVEQKGESFSIRTIAGLRQRFWDDLRLGQDWAGYPFADPVVHFYQQIANVKLDAGAATILPTLLFCHRDGMPAAAQLKQIGDGVYTVTGIPDPVVIGVASSAHPVTVTTSSGTLRTDAAAFLIERDHIALADATLLEINGRKVTFAQPTSVEFVPGAGDGVTSFETPYHYDNFSLPNYKASVDKAEVAPMTVDKLIQAAAEQPGKPYASLAGQDYSKLPALPVAWDRRSKLTEYLLTNNPGVLEAVDAGAKITAQPQPLAQNVFGGTRNSIEALTDGDMLQTDTCTQWDTNQPVTVTVDLGKPTDISRVVWYQWWANQSSRNKTYQLDTARFEVSDDGFRKDIREAGVYRDTAPHGNWGAPGYGPIRYEQKIAKQARQVRIVFTPKPGTGIYLAELQVWGNRKGLELDLSRASDRRVPSYHATDIAVGDLNGDGVDDVVTVSSGRRLTAYGSDGRQLWQQEFTAPQNVVIVDDLDGDGKPEVVCGGDDATLRCYSADGKLRWEHELPAYKGAAKIHVLFTAKLQTGNKRAVIAGADSWRYYALDDTGKELWWYESVHASTAGCAADLNGGGLDDIVCGTEYYWWPVVNPQGETLWSYNSGTGPGVNVVTTALFHGSARRAVLFGGQDSFVHALDSAGKSLWDYSTGDEITGLIATDLDGKPGDELVVSSMSFNVYGLAANGTRLWRTDLGSPVLKLRLVGTGEKRRLIAGCDDGSVYTLDMSGHVLARNHFLGAITAIAAPRDRQSDLRCVVASERGELQELRVDR